MEIITKVLKSLSADHPTSEQFAANFTELCTQVPIYLESLKFGEKERNDPHPDALNTETDHITRIKHSAVCNVSSAINFMLSVLKDNFDKYPVKMVQTSLDSMVIISTFDIYNSILTNNYIFEYVDTILKSNYFECFPACFQIIGNLCEEHESARKKLLHANLIPSYLQCFEKLLQSSTRNEDPQTISYSNYACKAFTTTVQNNESIQNVFVNSGASRLLLQYISENYKKKTDKLICGCINLLHYVSNYDNAKSAIDYNLFPIMLDIIKFSPNPDALKECLEYLENAIIKYTKTPSFAFECLQHKFFDELLTYIEQYKDMEIIDDKILTCLNFLIFISLPLNCSKYIYQTLNLQDHLFKLINWKNHKYSLSISLLLGNMCFNDEITTEFVSKRGFHSLILNNMLNVNVDEKSGCDFLISAFSILKNLAVPLQNRTIISKSEHFDTIIKIVIKSSNHIVLQKFFIFLRIIVTEPENSYASVLIKDKAFMTDLVMYSSEPEKYLILKSSALALLLQIIIYSKVKSIDFINEAILREIINYINPQFLSPILGNVKANSILFSLFTQENILFLLKNGYYKAMRELSADQPYPRLLLLNFIPPVRRIFAINDPEYDSYMKAFLDKKLFEAFKILESHPNLISKEELDTFLLEYNTKMLSLQKDD